MMENANALNRVYKMLWLNEVTTNKKKNIRYFVENAASRKSSSVIEMNVVKMILRGLQNATKLHTFSSFCRQIVFVLWCDDSKRAANGSGVYVYHTHHTTHSSHHIQCERFDYFYPPSELSVCTVHNIKTARATICVDATLFSRIFATPILQHCGSTHSTSIQLVSNAAAVAAICSMLIVYHLYSRCSISPSFPFSILMFSGCIIMFFCIFFPSSIWNRKIAKCEMRNSIHEYSDDHLLVVSSTSPCTAHSLLQYD